MRTPAIILLLSLAKITGAAVTPPFIVLFTDEFWWVGLHLDRSYLWSAALVVVLAGTWFIPASQQLFFPDREKRVITYHHVDVLNLAILAAVFLMMVSLPVLVVLHVLPIEWWLFPPEYMVTWFEGRGFAVDWGDRFHLALVVSTIGVLTGALGSSFHGLDMLRAIALFQKEP